MSCNDTTDAACKSVAISRLTGKVVATGNPDELASDSKVFPLHDADSVRRLIVAMENDRFGPNKRKMSATNREKAWAAIVASAPESLDLAELSAVPPEVYRLTSLKSAILPGTGLTADIGRLKDLEDLTVRGFRGVWSPPVEMATLPLRRLALDGVPLNDGKIPAEWEALPLEALKLERCGINRLPKTLPAAWENLQTLDLSGQDVVDPAMVSQCGKLTWLRLAGNPIEQFPDLSQSSETLVYLDLSSTQIREVPDALTSFPALVDVYLRGVRLTAVPHGEKIARMPKLEWWEMGETYRAQKARDEAEAECAALGKNNPVRAH
jgi:hypothetical protein